MRFLQGVRDPIDGGAQLLTKMLPESVVKAGNSLNNFLADKTGLVSKLPEGGVDQSVRDYEAEMQNARKATGNDGVDWARMGGNILSPANLALASRVPQAATLGGRMGVGAGVGAGFGALSPVTDGDFATQKAKQIGLGAATGVVAPVLTEGVARVIRPNTSQNVRGLLQEGITPTPGQILGGRFQTAEDKLTSIPILGDAISSARSKSIDELNRAGYNRALAPIAGTTPREVGREGVSSVRTQLSDAYDNLLPNISFRPDQQFVAEFQNVQRMAQQLPPAQAQRFEQVIRDQVAGKMTPAGLMNGAQLKEVESDLGRLVRGYQGDQAIDNRLLGNALAEVQRVIRDTLPRANPQSAEELRAINSGYANYTRLRDAASRQGSLEGRFTPGQLSGAVRAQDRTVGKRAFSEGNALMQDLSDPAKAVLSSQYPDSGSIGRLLLGLGAAGGAGYMSPAALGAGALATLPYLPGGRQITAGLLARRPDGAEAVADLIRQLGPALTPGLLVPAQQSAGLLK
jgi:hypothetical protein